MIEVEVVVEVAVVVEAVAVIIKELVL